MVLFALLNAAPGDAFLDQKLRTESAFTEGISKASLSCDSLRVSEETEKRRMDSVDDRKTRADSAKPVPGTRQRQAPKAAGNESGDRLALSIKLRRLRSDRGWTLDELSQRAGLARSTLSKIENGLMSPTYDLLQKIAQGFDIDMVDLFKPDVANVAAGMRSITRVNGGMPHETAAYRYEFLATDLSKKTILPLKARIHARSFSDFPEWIRHDGEEFLCVLSGTVEVLTEFYAPARLTAGESIYFDSRMGHALISVSHEEAEVLWVCTGRIDVHALKDSDSEPKNVT
jgi:transcriptional regulator with XRE-family HTH domain